jgi:quercetin dioxygenase-like cupin family protein
MLKEEFFAGLKADDFAQAVTIVQPVGYVMGAHHHDFDARALITAGQITLNVAGVASTYCVGDVFRLAAGTSHHEKAGPEGVTFLSGRRVVAA